MSVLPLGRRRAPDMMLLWKAEFGPVLILPDDFVSGRVNLDDARVSEGVVALYQRDASFDLLGEFVRLAVKPQIDCVA